MRINKWSAPVRNQSKLTRLFRADLEILNVQSEQEQQRWRPIKISIHVRRPCEVLANCGFDLLFMAYATRDFQHSIRTAATKRWRHTISTHVRRPCELLANCGFALHGVRNSTAATKRRQLATCQSPLVSAVRANCTHLGHQNQKKLML